MQTLNYRILRIKALFRRLIFELVKSLGFFYLIEKIPFIIIKEPYKTMYKRSKINKQ